MWQPPPPDVYKLNFDAAVFSGLERTGIGAITRNDKGEVMATDDAEKSSVSYTALTCSKQCLHNIKREDLAESTGVVPAKYPPKVKLELLTTLKC